MADRISSYADAVVSVAEAEGQLSTVSEELFRVARALDSSDELRMTLTDPKIPVSRRQQIVEDLLSGRASTTTSALVSMIVGAGRAGELGQIVRNAVTKAAHEEDKVVAEVRSSVELDEAQLQRLGDALRTSLGQDVEVLPVIDPQVLGGIVTTIGDTIIDGSVRTRINQLREAF